MSPESEVIERVERAQSLAKLLATMRRRLAALNPPPKGLVTPDEGGGLTLEQMAQRLLIDVLIVTTANSRKLTDADARFAFHFLGPLAGWSDLHQASNFVSQLAQSPRRIGKQQLSDCRRIADLVQKHVDPALATSLTSNLDSLLRDFARPWSEGQNVHGMQAADIPPPEASRDSFEPAMILSGLVLLSIPVGVIWSLFNGSWMITVILPAVVLCLLTIVAASPRERSEVALGLGVICVVGLLVYAGFFKSSTENDPGRRDPNVGGDPNDGQITHEEACDGLVIAKMRDADNSDTYEALRHRYCN